MAWMDKDKASHLNNGPFPCHAGEYCGNHTPPGLFFAGQNQRERKMYVDWLAQMRFGEPRATPECSVEYLKSHGIVGLYLRENQPIRSWFEIVPTPPQLMEPGKEHLYNVGGKPGISEVPQ